MAARALLLLIPVLLAACRMNGTMPLGVPSEAALALPDEFRLLCWNIEKGADRDFQRDMAQGVEQLVPDLLFLQEVRPDRLPKRVPAGAFAPSWRYPWPGGRAVGVATLSRARTMDPVGLQTDTREMGVIAPKTSIATKHALPGGGVLLAVNVHLLAFEGGKLTGFRRQMDGLGDRMRAHEGPILLGGDFNTWSPERLEVVRALAREVGLIEVAEFPEGRTTADQGSGFLNKLLGIDPALPLDRVFQRGLQVIRSRVLEQASSDHWPLLVDFRLAVPTEE